eukprot:766044-Hanusia_phi.AAC.6
MGGMEERRGNGGDGDEDGSGEVIRTRILIIVISRKFGAGVSNWSIRNWTIVAASYNAGFNEEIKDQTGIGYKSLFSGTTFNVRDLSMQLVRC